MNVSSVGGATPIKTPAAAEPKGPEVTNDHDGDDAATKPAAPAALPPGQGTMIDKKA